MSATPLHFGRASLVAASALAAAFAGGPAAAQTAAIGKLFSSAGTCSATVISGKNIIVTAAHCCWDRTKKGWIGGWSFAPAFNNGSPYGTFPWATVRVPNSWINNGDIPSDVCVLKLQNDSKGRPVTYYSGWLGRSWNYPAQQNMAAYGYPGNLGGGKTLQSCSAQSSAQPGSCGGNVLNMACNMTYGSSGGPWIRDLHAGDHVDATVHGYTNQKCTGTFGQTFNGPRFTSDNILMLCNAEGC